MSMINNCHFKYLSNYWRKNLKIDNICKNSENFNSPPDNKMSKYELMHKYTIHKIFNKGNHIF